MKFEFGVKLKLNNFLFVSNGLLIRSELTSNCQEKRLCGETTLKSWYTNGRGLNSVNSKLQQIFTSLETGVTHK